MDLIRNAPPKPARGSRRKAKARKARQFRKQRKACREAIYELQQMTCERCGCAVTVDGWEGAPNFAHVNEKLPRSLGGSAVDMANLELVCHACHLPNGNHAPTPERIARLKVLRTRG